MIKWTPSKQYGSESLTKRTRKLQSALMTLIHTNLPAYGISITRPIVRVPWARATVHMRTRIVSYWGKASLWWLSVVISLPMHRIEMYLNQNNTPSNVYMGLWLWAAGWVTSLCTCPSWNFCYFFLHIIRSWSQWIVSISVAQLIKLCAENRRILMSTFTFLLDVGVMNVYALYLKYNWGWNTTHFTSSFKHAICDAATSSSIAIRQEKLVPLSLQNAPETGA